MHGVLGTHHSAGIEAQQHYFGIQWTLDSRWTLECTLVIPTEEISLFLPEALSLIHDP